MKYLKLFLILIYIMFVPVFVFAEDVCENSDVIITDISLKKSTGNTEELSDATIENNSVNMNVKMYEVGDSIEYNISLKNQGTEDYILENNIQSNNDYINYTIEPKSEHDYKIESNEEKDYVLKAVYTREVSEEDFLSGTYNASGNPIVIVRDNTLINPETGTIITILFFLLSFILVTVIPLKSKNVKMALYIGIVALCSILPIYTEASCSGNIGLNCDITIGYVTPNPCTYDGNLVQGASYTNGQYTYYYKQKYQYQNSNYVLTNMDKDGWNIVLTDKTSTSPVTSKICTSINDKPIVSMDYTFGASQATSIDFSSFDTSNVETMSYMFYNSKVTELDLHTFDTSKITDYFWAFYCLDATTMDLSGFDFRNYNYSELLYKLGIDSASKSNLTTLKMNYAKFQSDLSYGFASKLQHLELNNVDLTNVVNMNYLFNGSSNLVDLQMENWHAENLETLDDMFYGCSLLKKVDLSNLNAKKIRSMMYIFSYCNSLEEVNVSNLVNANTTTVYGLFNGCPAPAKVIADNWVISSPSVVGGLFNYVTNRFKDVSIKNWVLPENLSYFGDNIRMSNLEKIDVSGWDLGNTTNCSHLFRDGYYLSTIIGMDTWKNTSNITNISYLFDNCQAIEEVDLTAFDYSNVTNVGYMFYSSRPKKIYMGNFNAENLEDASYMFYNNGYIENIYFESISTPVLKNTYSMFAYSNKIKSLDLTGMDVSQVTNMSCMFSGLSSMTTLDISTFDTNDSMNMNYLFQSCSNLQTIYVKNQANATRFSNSSVTYIPSGATITIKT